MKPQISLRRKIMLFTASYTLVLVAAFFLYFGISSRQNISQIAEQQITATSAQFSSVLQQKIKLCTSELNGLTSSIQLANRHDLPGIQNRIEAVLLEKPGKFESFSLFQKNEGYALHPRKSKKDYFIEKIPIDDEPLNFSAFSDSIVINGPISGQFGPTLELYFVRANSQLLFKAVVNLNFLFQSVRDVVALPSRLSLVVTDTNGVIIDSHSTADLKKNKSALFPSVAAKTNLGTHKHGSNSLISQTIIDMPSLFLIVRCDLRQDIVAWRQQLGRISVITFFIIVIGLIFAWSVARRFVKSIGDVTSVATRVAQGDFSQKLRDQRNDEFGVLFQTFNQMTQKLQRSYDALRASNIQLEEKISELTETRKELSQKQRLALVGEAISKISHEIQNKIGGVSIWVQNLERYLASDPDASDYIDELKLAMQSFMDMLVHFKRFYREPVLNRQPTDLVKILHNGILAVDADFKNKNIHIEKKSDGSTIVNIDGEQIKDVLVNILLNAIYYTPTDGRITIDLTSGKTRTTLSMCDSGPGIAEDNIETIFQPFFTTKSGGSGLGLAISQNIIKAHGGRLTAHNSEKGGAVFVIEL